MSSTGTNLRLPLIATTVAIAVTVAYIYYRNRKNRENDSSLDEAPLGSEKLSYGTQNVAIEVGWKSDKLPHEKDDSDGESDSSEVSVDLENVEYRPNNILDNYHVLTSNKGTNDGILLKHLINDNNKEIFEALSIITQDDFNKKLAIIQTKRLNELLLDLESDKSKLEDVQEKFLLMLCQMNSEQRVVFAKYFGVRKLKNIIDNVLDFKSESSHTQRMIRHLFRLPHQNDASWLKDTFAESNVEFALDILCTRSNHQLSLINQCIEDEYNSSLKEQILYFLECDKDDIDDYDGLRLFLSNVADLKRFESFDINFDVANKELEKIDFMFSTKAHTQHKKYKHAMKPDDKDVGATSQSPQDSIKSTAISDLSPATLAKHPKMARLNKLRLNLINVLSTFNYSEISVLTAMNKNFKKMVLNDKHWESNKFTRKACHLALEMSEADSKHFYFANKLFKMVCDNNGVNQHRREERMFVKFKINLHSQIYSIIFSRCETDLSEILSFFDRLARNHVNKLKNSELAKKAIKSPFVQPSTSHVPSHNLFTSFEQFVTQHAPVSERTPDVAKDPQLNSIGSIQESAFEAVESVADVSKSSDTSQPAQNPPARDLIFSRNESIILLALSNLLPFEPCDFADLLARSNDAATALSASDDSNDGGSDMSDFSVSSRKSRTSRATRTRSRNTRHKKSKTRMSNMSKFSVASMLSDSSERSRRGHRRGSSVKWTQKDRDDYLDQLKKSELSHRERSTPRKLGPVEIGRVNSSDWQPPDYEDELRRNEELSELRKEMKHLEYKELSRFNSEYAKQQGPRQVTKQKHRSYNSYNPFNSKDTDWIPNRKKKSERKLPTLARDDSFDFQQDPPRFRSHHSQAVSSQSVKHVGSPTFKTVTLKKGASLQIRNLENGDNQKRGRSKSRKNSKGSNDSNGDESDTHLNRARTQSHLVTKSTGNAGKFGKVGGINATRGGSRSTSKNVSRNVSRNASRNGSRRGSKERAFSPPNLGFDLDHSNPSDGGVTSGSETERKRRSKSIHKVSNRSKSKNNNLTAGDMFKQGLRGGLHKPSQKKKHHSNQIISKRPQTVRAGDTMGRSKSNNPFFGKKSARQVGASSKRKGGKKKEKEKNGKQGKGGKNGKNGKNGKENEFESVTMVTGLKAPKSVEIAHDGLDELAGLSGVSGMDGKQAEEDTFVMTLSPVSTIDDDAGDLMDLTANDEHAMWPKMTHIFSDNDVEIAKNSSRAGGDPRDLSIYPDESDSSEITSDSDDSSEGLTGAKPAKAAKAEKGDKREDKGRHSAATRLKSRNVKKKQKQGDRSDRTRGKSVHTLAKAKSGKSMKSKNKNSKTSKSSKISKAPKTPKGTKMSDSAHKFAKTGYTRKRANSGFTGAAAKGKENNKSKKK